MANPLTVFDRKGTPAHGARANVTSIKAASDSYRRATKVSPSERQFAEYRVGRTHLGTFGSHVERSFIPLGADPIAADEACVYYVYGQEQHRERVDREPEPASREQLAEAVGRIAALERELVAVREHCRLAVRQLEPVRFWTVLSETTVPSAPEITAEDAPFLSAIFAESNASE